MKQLFSKQLSLTGKGILLLITPILAILPHQKAQAFCNQDVPLSSILPQCTGNTGGHTDITKNGLPFLRKEVQDAIIDANKSQDIGTNILSGSEHFDNSNFTGGVKSINNRYNTQVIPEFLPKSPDPFGATNGFGRLLHTAQDFYAHSNWVDYDPSK